MGGNTSDTYDKEKACEKKKSDSQYGESDQLFLKFDTDKNNYLYEQEFVHLLDHFLLIRPELQEKVNQVQREIKIDNNAPLSKEEFRSLMTQCFEEVDISEKLIEVFKIFDKNLELQLSNIEVLHVFNKLGLNLTLEDVDKLFEEALNGKKGELTFEDFIKIMVAK